MYDYIKGTIVELKFNSVVVDNGGIGYLVYGTKDHIISYPFKLLYNCIAPSNSVILYTRRSKVLSLPILFKGKLYNIV